MAGPALHVFTHPDADTYQDPLARREIYWQLKDRATTGYGFPLSQVEPVEDGLPPAIEAMELPRDAEDRLREELARRTPDHGYYAVPETTAHDGERLASRLALAESILIFPDLEEPSTVRTLEADASWWEEGPGSGFPGSQEADTQAALNIAHPYMTGTLWHPDLGDDVHIIEDHGAQSVSFDSLDGPLYTAALSPTEGSWGSAEDVLPRVRGSLAKQDGFGGWATHDMRSEVTEGDLQTECVSPGSLLVTLPPDLEAMDEAVLDFIRDCDEQGLSLAGHYPSRDRGHLLFKLQPRDPELDEIGPGFSPERELAKLHQVQWARETFAGYKLGPPGGARERTLDRFDGWRIYVERPGRKAADDFTVHVEGPDEERELDLEDGLEPFTLIFTEGMLRMHDRKSGEDFLEAVWRLWTADQSPDEVIDEMAPKVVPCEYEDELAYPARALLWIIGLVFIVEDVNYRFNFHPLPRSMVRYRKQGRDQPMSAILGLGTKPLSRERAHEYGRKSIEEGGVYDWPTAFEGPNHLAGWFDARLGIQ